MRGILMRQRTVSLLLGIGIFLALQGLGWCAEGGEHGGGHGLNWGDFLLRVFNFAILLALMVKLLKKPLSNFFATRREDIQKLLTELQAKRLEAERVSSEYKTKLSALDDQTKEIVAELLSEGEAEKQKIIDAAKRQAEYIKQQAQLAAQQEIKIAREKLQEEVAELSVAAAEDILRKHIKAEDQDRLVKDFMTRVVEAK
jgi:F-type H+-transporting ATPase subunit b